MLSSLALKSATAVTAGLLATSLAGCAENTPSPSETPTAQPSATAPDVPVDAAASFRAIADDSCDRAYDQGVVESNDDGIMFLVPEDLAYQDYTAAFDSESDGIGVIWSTEVFFVCAASIGYQMAEEGDSDYPIEVTFDASNGTYRTLLEVEDYGTLDYTYSVVDGAFTEVEWVTPEESGYTAITYGPPSEELRVTLRTAVDAFLADE